MPDNKIDLSFYSELNNVKRIVKVLLNFFDENIPELDYNDRFDLRLIYSELLCNAVIHGNLSDSNKKVNLTVEISGNIISSIISDEGSGYNVSSMFSRIQDSNLDSENGRGMKLVCSLTDSISIENMGSQVMFSKKVKING